ncbi:NLR family CARD domain-containing protein 3-like [Xyrichtys novacula]|uniref:NLR family CARD domain-containing protein 3-like n=1 Tax=Xyrichtys novacula TaxID=13765 RepID=A0AAV1GY99_XYRNO|nr:NLR family CARD domain-containing protein 3-like [Xyrichtys novacula]
MNRSEERREGAPLNKTPVSKDCGCHTKPQSLQTQHGPHNTEHGPGPSCMSTKSDKSIDRFIDLKGGEHSSDLRVSQKNKEVYSDQQPPIDLDSVFSLLQGKIVTFVKNELKKYQQVLTRDDPEFPESGDNGIGDDTGLRSSREALLKITLHFLKLMKHEALADSLQSSESFY